MRQGIYLPPDANEAFRKTQSWQTYLLGFASLLASLLVLKILMAGKAIPLIIPLHIYSYSLVSKILIKLTAHQPLHSLGTLG